MQNVIDLATERFQRQELANRVAEGAEQFAGGLQYAGECLANLAWVLAAPVRSYDEELKWGIYKLLLERLSGIVTDSIDSFGYGPEVRARILERSMDTALSSFQMRLLALAASKQDVDPEL